MIYKAHFAVTASHISDILIPSLCNDIVTSLLWSDSVTPLLCYDMVTPSLTLVHFIWRQRGTLTNQALTLRTAFPFSFVSTRLILLVSMYCRMTSINSSALESFKQRAKGAPRWMSHTEPWTTNILKPVHQSTSTRGVYYKNIMYL